MMTYYGLGQRLSIDAADVIAYYVTDGNQPLTATSGGNTTFYLYGLVPLPKRQMPFDKLRTVPGAIHCPMARIPRAN
jgi:hypothetical protein